MELDEDADKWHGGWAMLLWGMRPRSLPPKRPRHPEELKEAKQGGATGQGKRFMNVVPDPAAYIDAQDTHQHFRSRRHNAGTLAYPGLGIGAWHTAGKADTWA